jgi:hypothetical protein
MLVVNKNDSFLLDLTPKYEVSDNDLKVGAAPE